MCTCFDLEDGWFSCQDIIVKPVENRSSSLNQDGSGDGDHKVKVAPWRFGPAQLWYDRIGVDETGDNFDYGFKVKLVSKRLF